MASSAPGSRRVRMESRRPATEAVVPGAKAAPTAITVHRGFRVRAILMARPAWAPAETWPGQMVRLAGNELSCPRKPAAPGLPAPGRISA
jgi:hypothetical protein